MSEYISLGTTSDFDWYELSQIKSQLETLSHKVDRLIQVIQRREKEQGEYVIYLKTQCDSLRVELNTLRESQNAV